MEFEEFREELLEKMSNISINLTEKQVKQFYDYMNLLLEWNEKINLTAITEFHEIILKHFVDSVTISQFVSHDKSLVDVGTGAGFPGIPLKILRPDLEIVLMDSLQKRINFLNEVILKLKLEKIQTIHARAEELGKNKKYREKFDFATSRAVANLSVLLEYLVPFVKKDGKVICMKGSDITEELENSKKAENILGVNIESKEFLYLPGTDMERNILIYSKIKNTPKEYPRKAGTPSKNPIR